MKQSLQTPYSPEPTGVWLFPGICQKVSGAEPLSTAAALLTGCGKAEEPAKDADQLARIQEAGEITIAMEGTWAPWTYHNENDELVGFDVEVGKAIAEKLQGCVVKLAARAGESGKLFGSITSKEISEGLASQCGINIEKNKIVQAEPIKSYGSYTVKAKLGYEISGNISVLVVEG